MTPSANYPILILSSTGNVKARITRGLLEVGRAVIVTRKTIWFKDQSNISVLDNTLPELRELMARGAR